jgi:hypothetical protein
MTSQNDTQATGADLSAEERTKQALDAMAALGLIKAPQKVTEDYTQGYPRQIVDGKYSSRNQDTEFWVASAAHGAKDLLAAAKSLANTIATRDYFLSGPTVEDLEEQLAAVKDAIAASVPGLPDDRIYGSLWLSATDLQERITAAEESMAERAPRGLPRTGTREDVIVLASESSETAVLRALKTKLDPANRQQEAPEQPQL